ncbi:heavy-metal-associated domain-containing protein [Bdellovibrio sp. NC01]|uniref:heavy-metal-associated domain-containing protein n=1 Tax=Bdellovibrio sp. NC01 TaxID=2220073 RepID=UPI00115B153D|nr:heavy metal-associated domain-containing protein [Bdellovibrio sp. NC01]QDK37190.1 heavy-metal-associated domain-containing protein [Bdellovibrio sp. NC01]
MNKAILIISLLFTSAAFADTTTYEVEGMHCGGCAKMIQSKVCGMDGMEKCEVTMGKIVVATKPGITISQEKIQEAMAKAGDYKITGSKSSK